MRVLTVYRNLSDGERYAAALRLAGITPVLAEAAPRVRIGDCSGLLLTGGTDVNPALYGECALETTDEPDRQRDACEGELIDEALGRDIPLFAICRGMQLLNVHLGGKLIQHLTDTDHHQRRTPDRGLPAHSVSVEPGTTLFGINQKAELQVNSRHHQAVATVAPGLIVSATDPFDGVIEAVEFPGRRFVAGVQWHPEDQASRDADQLRLFTRFRAALEAADTMELSIRESE